MLFDYCLIFVPIICWIASVYYYFKLMKTYDEEDEQAYYDYFSERIIETTEHLINGSEEDHAEVAG